MNKSIMRLTQFFLHAKAVIILTAFAFAMFLPSQIFAQDPKTKKEQKLEVKQLKKDEDLKVDAKKFSDLDPNSNKPKKPVPVKKKQKRRTYYDLKIRKRVIVTKNAKGILVEKFFVLKTPVMPSKYVEETYFYDIKKKAIVKLSPNSKFEPEKYEILHGLYTKKKDNKFLLAEGFYYTATKHGTWNEYVVRELIDTTKNKTYQESILVDKAKYNRGFPKEAQITYFDSEQTQIKEIIPFQMGEQTGAYYLYYPSGRLAVKGDFELGQRVGKWYEYYDRDKKNKKKIITYQKSALDPYQEPIVEAWDDKGDKIN